MQAEGKSWHEELRQNEASLCLGVRLLPSPATKCAAGVGQLAISGDDWNTPAAVSRSWLWKKRYPILPGCACSCAVHSACAPAHMLVSGDGQCSSSGCLAAAAAMAGMEQGQPALISQFPGSCSNTPAPAATRCKSAASRPLTGAAAGRQLFHDQAVLAAQLLKYVLQPRRARPAGGHGGRQSSGGGGGRCGRGRASNGIRAAELALQSRCGA